MFPDEGCLPEFKLFASMVWFMLNSWIPTWILEFGFVLG